MRFEFATAGRILFGPGTVREAAPIAAQLLANARPGRALVVTGRTTARAQPLLDALSDRNVECSVFPIPGEPTVGLVRQAVQQALGRCGLVIAIGGGSTLDAGKAVAALLVNPGDPLDYLEVIGRGRSLERPSVPFVAIPTTAGTGTEVTRNAVLTASDQQVKVSLRSPHMLPTVAIVDPELTYDLPPAITAATGLDALTQLIEPFVCIRANPMTDAVCREGIARAARSLRRVCEDPRDPAAREDMSLASLFGGLALANAGLGAVHGFASPIGGMFNAPHGAVCAALLPHVMAVNVAALQSRQPDNPTLARYDEIARIVTGDLAATARDAVAWTADLCRALRIPALAAYGLTPTHVPVLIRKASTASSMKPNPIPLTPEELETILTRAL